MAVGPRSVGTSAEASSGWYPQNAPFFFALRAFLGWVFMVCFAKNAVTHLLLIYFWGILFFHVSCLVLFFMGYCSGGFFLVSVVMQEKEAQFSPAERICCVLFVLFCGKRVWGMFLG